MNKIFKTVLFALFAITGFAQGNEPDDQTPADPKVQEKIRNLRIAYISDKLGLTPDQAEKFWPVYREFADKRKATRQELIDAHKAARQGGVDPKTDENLVNLGLKIKQMELDLEKDYSGRLLKVISAQQMLNLRKAEKDFQMMVLQQLQQRRLMQQRQENFRDRNQQLRKGNN